MTAHLVGEASSSLPQGSTGRPALSDAGVVTLAAAVWIGVRIAHPLPVVLGLAAAAGALAARRPMLLVGAGLLLGCTFGASAIAGLRPVDSSSFDGAVTLLSDPVDQPGSTVADVRVGRRHVELRATGGGRGELAARLAGERVSVEGHLHPPPPDSPWLAPRHITGVLDAVTVDPIGAGSAPWRAANTLRRTLVRGAESMSADRRSLFTGFVLGDDRDQPATLTDDFRGSGLTHLLAVSGENVAFVLALAGPVLRRLRLGPRWAMTVAVIAFFALVTRFEPSVLRAGVMAALAATAFALGRPASGVRLLSLAVAGLVLVDPLLIRSVGFQLSVAASGGILVIGPQLRRSLPGPAWLIEPLAVTAGAQLAVAPLMVATFGGVPVASLPANLLAGPVAGLVMTWGLGAGIPAGVLGGRVAALLHAPTSLGIGWIAAVARIGSTVPLGEMHGVHVVVLAVALAGVWAAHRWRNGALTRIGTVVVVAGLLSPAIALRRPPPSMVPVPGGRLWRAGGGAVLVVGTVPKVDDLLEALRRAGVRRIDLVVAGGTPPSAAAVVEAVAHRWPPAAAWSAEPGPATTAPPSARCRIGDLLVDVRRVGPALVTRVSVDGSA